jgi:hypothetical protein
MTRVLMLALCLVCTSSGLVFGKPVRFGTARHCECRGFEQFANGPLIAFSSPGQP